MATGDLVFIDGNQAGIIIGEGVGDDGSPDGSVIIGTFAGATQVERGHYGSIPSVAGENPPSYVPEGTIITPEAGATQPVAPSAGGLETAEPIEPGATDVTVTGDDEAAEAQVLADKDAEIATLREQLAASQGGTQRPEPTRPPAF